ncbi:MAG: cupin domain-containing protein [Flavobacteriales bacterium]|nr:cupin domain-containing protein [Flavobacteriales bacterium]
MRTIHVSILFIVISSLCSAQQYRSLEDLAPSGAYDNIHVQKLDDDSLTTTYVIWVKQSVKEHFHAAHTEVVYVLEGKGTMTLDDDERVMQKGDYVFIPKGTRHSVQVLSDEAMKVLSIQTPQFDGSDRVFVDQQ